MGINGYARMRLMKATEDKKYPELVSEADAAAAGVNPNDPSGQETKQEKKLVTPVKKAAAAPKKV
jgi:hypothetical protein